MRATIAIAGLSMILASSAAFAESTTVIEQKDGKYDEKYKNDDGTKSQYHVNEKDGTSVYKDSNGVVVKERIEDGKVKQDYKDGDCTQSTQKDLVTGDTKIVAKGDCQK